MHVADGFSSWFSLSAPRRAADDSILPKALSRSMTTDLPISTPPSAHRRRSRSPTLSRLRRRGLIIALLVALPVLAILYMDERHAQRVAVASWAAELAARENAAFPDAQGGVDLQGWRARMAKRPTKELARRAVVGEGEDAWPAWWGNADAVGPSPFDHVPPPLGGEKRRILFLTAYDDYLERMNTHTYEIVDGELIRPPPTWTLNLDLN